MNTRNDIQNAIDRYVLSITTRAPEVAPLAADCVYGGPMVPDPLRGDERIRQYLGEISPFIARVRLLKTIIDGDNAATVVEIESIRGRTIQGAWLFEFKNGLISAVQVYFDSRLLIQDMA